MLFEGSVNTNKMMMMLGRKMQHIQGENILTEDTVKQQEDALKENAV